jgi:hypothetical protein
MLEALNNFPPSNRINYRTTGMNYSSIGKGRGDCFSSKPPGIDADFGMSRYYEIPAFAVGH